MQRNPSPSLLTVATILEVYCGVRSPEGFSDIALSKVGFEDLSFSAKATNCDSHLKALAMVTTVR
jgi:hypothetical protein